MNRTAFRHIAAATLLVAALYIDTPLLAQGTIKANTPGTTFSVIGRNGQVEGFAGGIRVHGKGFEVVKLRGVLQIPSSGSALSQMQRMVVRFRTSSSGPSLRSVDLYNGQQKAFHIDTNLSGDYTSRETTTPATLANAWAWNPGIKVSAQSVVVLEVQFPGGFEGSSNTGELVLLSVEADFPRVPITGKSSMETTDVLTSTGRAPTSQPAVPPGAPNAVIYALANNNDLLWYRHDGRGDGTFKWATGAARKVGSGWTGKHIFPGGDGVIYVVTDNNDLLWYRHDGRDDGNFRWDAAAGRKVGTGWDFKQLFSGGGGVIYAITNDGELLWYRHDGRGDGSFRWAADAGKKIGTGWSYKQVFSGGGGVIYAITEGGELLWFRHDGYADGSNRWATAEGKNVGVGWIFTHVFPAGEGVIYAVNANNDLLWYRHDGRSDGSVRWMDNQGRKVGNGWAVKEIFSGATL